MQDFDNAFRDQLTALMRWRRDVRRFRTDPVPEAMLLHCLDAFVLSPSVGLSQPWRLIRVESAAARAAALANFEAANAQALAGYDGAGTMPEMRRYSVVASVMQFWLLARAHGLGVGWVSILDPARLARDLDTPEAWRLVAYLCVGWPEAESETPELERHGWEVRRDTLVIETR